MAWPNGFSCTIDPVSVEQPALRELRAYWERKRQGRRMPRRADIDPAELRSHMGNLVLIDVLAPADDFRYRLIGTNVTARHGRDSTGKTVRELYERADPVTFDWSMTVLRSAVSHRAPVLATNRLQMVNKEFVRSEQLHLPLSEDGETVNMILCESIISTIKD